MGQKMPIKSAKLQYYSLSSENSKDFTLDGMFFLHQHCLHISMFSLPDMEEYNLFTQARFEPKLFYPKKCANCNDFATKQCKMYFTKSMSKIGLPHIYRGNYYVINNKFSSF